MYRMVDMAGGETYGDGNSFSYKTAGDALQTTCGTCGRVAFESLDEGRKHAQGHTEVPYWWLSFTDPSLPEGTQFLGAALIAAPTFEQAYFQACLLGINPGGEVAGMGPVVAQVPERWVGRLLTRIEVDEFDAFMLNPPPEQETGT